MAVLKEPEKGESEFFFLRLDPLFALFDPVDL